MDRTRGYERNRYFTFLLPAYFIISLFVSLFSAPRIGISYLFLRLVPPARCFLVIMGRVPLDDGKTICHFHSSLCFTYLHNPVRDSVYICSDAAPWRLHFHIRPQHNGAHPRLSLFPCITRRISFISLLRSSGGILTLGFTAGNILPSCFIPGPVQTRPVSFPHFLYSRTGIYSI